MADEKKPMDIMKSTQWRIVSSVLILILFLYLWNQFFKLGSPERYPITYSQFIEQLNAGNIKSVTIRNLQVNGEFIKEINIQLPDEKKDRGNKNISDFSAFFSGRRSP